MSSKDEYQRNKLTYKNRETLKKYGITWEEKRLRLEAQNDACAICSRPLNMSSAQIDHNHRTGKIRGLLCIYCNHLLGNAEDLIITLQNAIQYLEEHSEWELRIYDRKTT